MVPATVVASIIELPNIGPALGAALIGAALILAVLAVVVVGLRRP